jgi:transcriptional regulator with XRE-family HTH domain
MDQTKEIGARIRKARKAIKIDGRAMSLAAVGQRMGVTSQTVGNWERGRGIDVSVLLDLARILDVSATWLLIGPESQSLDADLYLVPMDDREFAKEQAKRVINRWISKA